MYKGVVGVRYTYRYHYWFNFILQINDVGCIYMIAELSMLMLPGLQN